MTDGDPEALVSRYKIVRELGHGAMARVYRATEVNTGRDVALKVPSWEGDRGPDTLRRFLREVRLAVRLVHPHIVRVQGGFEHDGLPWLVMELIEGPSLAERIDAQGPLPLADVLAHGVGLASALGLAHARGILHHDISPVNILMAADGRAKILDFGLASFTSTAPSLERGVGPVVGTAGYIAPEKILGRHPDARSDVFSLGAVLFEMITGRPAFPGSTRDEIIDATLAIEPAEIESTETEMKELARIVRKAMAKSPDDRYATAGALEADLRQLHKTVIRESAQNGKS